MLATLNRPIVTDYVPAIKPPWVLLALVIVLAFAVTPRELIHEVCVAAAVVTVAGLLIGWVRTRLSRRADDRPEDPGEFQSPGDWNCRAA